MVTKTTQSKSVSGAKVMPGASIPLKAMASSPTSVSKVATIVSSPRAGVLKISARKKGPVAALWLVTKGNKRGSKLGLP
jgi:hypothetical protein